VSYAVRKSPDLAGRGAMPAGRGVCRFSGCNLWSGREQIAPPQHVGFATPICRTDGTLGDRYASAGNSPTPSRAVDGSGVNRYVVLTGGEPLLQVDAALIDALHGVASASGSRPMADRAA